MRDDDDLPPEEPEAEGGDLIEFFRQRAGAGGRQGHTRQGQDGHQPDLGLVGRAAAGTRWRQPDPYAEDEPAEYRPEDEETEAEHARRMEPELAAYRRSERMLAVARERLAALDTQAATPVPPHDHSGIACDDPACGVDATPAHRAELVETIAKLEMRLSWGRPPEGWTPPAERSAPEHAQSDRGRFEAELASRLTPAQLAHWGWLQEGEEQGVIGKRLGINQSGVSKREAKLWEMVDQAHIAAHGRPYPRFLGKRRRGPRGRQE